MTIVYVVMGGWDYEGYDTDSVRVFATIEAAQVYAEQLESDINSMGNPRYDYSNIIERSVEGK